MKEKDCQCNHYDKAFTCHSSLLRHKRTHTGEKPYESVQCGKVFPQSSHPKGIKEHTLERNLKSVISVLKPLQVTVIFCLI